MKKLIYKIHRNEDETGSTTLVMRGNKIEIEKEWETLRAEAGFNYDLSVGWELDGKCLGTTLLDLKNF